MASRNIGKVSLSPEERKALAEDLANYYEDVREEPLGIIERDQLMDWFMESAAPVIYNKALDDAKAWYRKMQDDIDSEYYALYKDI